MLWFGGVMALLVTAMAFPPERLSSEADWELWKTTYGKEYSSRKEEEIRRSVWEKNMLMIQAHNHEYEQGLQSYQLGMNQLGDMTTEEVTAKMTGLKLPRTRETNNTLPLDKFPGKLPKSIDYRKMGFVTPVRNQGACLSCWAFSAVGALEGQLMKARRTLVSLSPQNLVDCSSSYGCKGGHMINAYKYMQRTGIDSEKTYPYVHMDEACAYNKSDRVAQIWGYKVFPKGDERALKAAVANYGPIAVQINAGLHSFQYYRGGVYSNRECRKNAANHAMLVVGYGATCKCEKFWIIKNSWGQNWGEKGYMRIARNRGNICGIADLPSVPLL